MIKYILPAIIIFLIILFWEKITESVYKKLKIRLNYIVVILISLILVVIFFLLNN